MVSRSLSLRRQHGASVRAGREESTLKAIVKATATATAALYTHPCLFNLVARLECKDKYVWLLMQR